MKISAEHLRDWAKIGDDWQVTRLNTHKEVRNGTRYQTTWFSAVNETTSECHRYRVWLNEGMSPPYRKQQGWELFDTTGDPVDCEIRYSKRGDNEYLH